MLAFTDTEILTPRGKSGDRVFAGGCTFHQSDRGASELSDWRGGKPFYLPYDDYVSGLESWKKN